MNELYHHGIKGMRWGVRRYQNADGSYTAAGKARYKTDTEDLSKKTDKELREANRRYELERKYRENTKSPDRFKNRLETTRSIANDSSNIANRTREIADRSNARANRQRPMKPMDLSHMTDQELRDRINRGNLERQYTQLYGSPQAASGRERVATVLDYAGAVLAIGGSAASIALAIHELSK